MSEEISGSIYELKGFIIGVLLTIFVIYPLGTFSYWNVAGSNVTNPTHFEYHKDSNGPNDLVVVEFRSRTLTTSELELYLNRISNDLNSGKTHVYESVQ